MQLNMFFRPIASLLHSYWFTVAITSFILHLDPSKAIFNANILTAFVSRGYRTHETAAEDTYIPKDQHKEHGHKTEQSKLRLPVLLTHTFF